jgi:hypothetical protein
MILIVFWGVVSPLYLRREEENIDGKKKRHWGTAREKNA